MRPLLDNALANIKKLPIGRSHLEDSSPILRVRLQLTNTLQFDILKFNHGQGKSSSLETQLISQE
jgi:hypothetical protein